MFCNFCTQSKGHIFVKETMLSMSLLFNFVVLRATINNGENKFKEKVRERNTRFTWFDKLSTSTGERAAVIIILIIGLQ